MPTHAEQPTPDLLPCPFCGGAPGSSLREDPDGYAVQCSSCHVVGRGGRTRDQAATLWNGRSLAGLGLSGIEATAHTMRIKDGVLSIDPPEELLAALRKVTAQLRRAVANQNTSEWVEPMCEQLGVLEAEALLKRIDEKGGRGPMPYRGPSGRVMFHDDDCGGIIGRDGLCGKCGIIPDMQSLGYLEEKGGRDG